MTDRIDLDSLEAALAAGTPGPWRAGKVTASGYMVASLGSAAVCPPAGVVPSPSSDADAALIVALVNAAPEMIAELRRLRGLVERMAGHIEAAEEVRDAPSAAFIAVGRLLLIEARKAAT